MTPRKVPAANHRRIARIAPCYLPTDRVGKTLPRGGGKRFDARRARRYPRLR